jgi:predicted negative regulator of RcsB-dependent stress response
MATEAKTPAGQAPASTTTTEQRTDKAQLFWNKNGKYIVYGFAAIVLLIGGYVIYQNYFKKPEEQKAADAMWKAEEFYRTDSIRLALNGSGANQGFLRIISKYGGTKAGNLARFYAGSCYMKLGDFNNAIKQLKEFNTSDELLKVRAAGLLGDAYAETGKKNEAVENYKKAGTIFEEDNVNSPEYLFRAGLMYETMGKNQDAIEMYSIIKQKYPSTQRGIEIDKYLARLGKVK